jgi:ribosome biogenesis protein BMS1
MDIGEKKLHVPQVDRTPLEAPPIVVAVVGPPGVSSRTANSVNSTFADN